MENELKRDPTCGTTGWYIAELVIKVTVEGDWRNVVHKNLILIKADSPSDAYNRALKVGDEHAMSYKNPRGKQVGIEFLGLSKLNVVYDRLEDGAELSYDEYVGLPDEQIRGLVVPKNSLAVFRDLQPLSRPDYSSAEVLQQASKLAES